MAGRGTWRATPRILSAIAELVPARKPMAMVCTVRISGKASMVSPRTHIDRSVCSSRVRNVHQDPAVRVRPLEFFDRAFKSHLLVGIEHRKGMMCKSRDRIHGNRDSRETKGFEVHERLLSDCFRLGMSDKGVFHT